jgi:outer membrane lipoprotein-sorting protein
VLCGVRAAGADSAFDRMQAAWNGVHDYSVTIESHEQLGSVSDEHEFFYAFRKPDKARLDVVKGPRSGGTILWDGGQRVTAYKRALSLFKLHASAWDKNLTTLRGNGILSSNMGDVVECFGAHRSVLREREGPVVDGVATDEIELPYAGIQCADDPPDDRGTVTLDVIDVSKVTGFVVLRKRYAGDDVVERWQMRDYKIDAGIDDAEFR